MKKTILILLALLSSSVLTGQQAMSISEAKEQGLTITKLDSIYKDGLNVDTSKAVFSNKQKYFKSWRKLLQDFGNYLKENDFKWTDSTKVFNKVYFAKNGTIDYFMYNIHGDLSKEKRQKFKKLLNDFINNYSFQMTANVKFTQCGKAVYAPGNDK